MIGSRLPDERPVLQGGEAATDITGQKRLAREVEVRITKIYPVMSRLRRDKLFVAHTNLGSLNAHLCRRESSTAPAPTHAQERIITVWPADSPTLDTTEEVVAIGTSTGGTLALEAVLSALPSVCPGIVFIQHMPEKFTAAFAQRLDSGCEIEVRKAKHHDRVLPGQALIAPSGKHMTMKAKRRALPCRGVRRPHVNRHRPSVDVLFRSAARSAGRNALGLIITGMDDDGASSLKEILRQAAAHRTGRGDLCGLWHAGHVQEARSGRARVGAKSDCAGNNQFRRRWRKRAAGKHRRLIATSAWQYLPGNPTCSKPQPRR